MMGLFRVSYSVSRSNLAGWQDWSILIFDAEYSLTGATIEKKLEDQAPPDVCGVCVRSTKYRDARCERFNCLL